MNKDREKVTLHVPITYLCDTWKGQFRGLLPNETYEIILTYPLTYEARFKFKTGKRGVSLAGVLQRIGKAYEYVYQHENKYGIYGHEMGDLSLDSVTVNHKTKKINVSMSS